MSTRLPFLYVKTIEGKGRGIFTAQEIPAGTPIETCPVLVLPAEDTPLVHRTRLHDYYFLWGEDGQCAIALGFGSLYNHASAANADYVMDMAQATIDIRAVRDIAPGEEITINYTSGGLQKTDLWFREV